MDSLLFRIRTIIKVLWVYIFYFPGLVLHEGSHALAAIVTLSKITKVSLFPSIQFAPDDSAYKVTYGYVRSVASFKAAYMLIGLAPLFLWLIPIFITIHMGWVDINTFKIDFPNIFSIENWWFFMLVFQIAWAGFPSRQDMRVFLEGLFSFSGIFILGISLFLLTSPISIDDLPLWGLLP